MSGPLFFAVLMVGFAYVWRLGDLDWVRARARGGEAPQIAEAADEAAIEAIRLAAGLTTRPLKQTATLLARWPSAPALRPFLRRLNTARPTNQLSLL